MSNSESFTCFYTTQPFWAVTKPDIDIIKNDEKLFYNTLAEEVIKYDNSIFAIRICKDGLIMVQIHELEKKRKQLDMEKKENILVMPIRSEYVAYLNVIQLILDSATLKQQNHAYFKISQLTHDDIFRCDFQDGRFSSSGVPKNITSNYYNGRYLSLYLPYIPIKYDSRIRHRQTIKEEVFQTMVSDLKKIVSDYENKVKILNIVSTAVSEYKNLNFDTSIIQSWFVIEYFLNLYWDKFLSSKENMNKDRKDFLTGRDLTSSIISNILEINKNIDSKIFKKIDYSRRKRNAIVHKLEDKLNHEDCQEAFQVLEYFINNNLGTILRLNTALSWRNI